MTDDEKCGVYTYDSMLDLLAMKQMRLRAEIDGFLAARDGRMIGGYGIPDLQDSYQTGFYLGKLYLAKDKDGKP